MAKVQTLRNTEFLNATSPTVCFWATAPLRAVDWLPCQIRERQINSVRMSRLGAMRRLMSRCKAGPAVRGGTFGLAGNDVGGHP